MKYSSNKDESQKHLVRERSQIQKTACHLGEMSRKGESIEADSRLVFA